MSSDAKSPGTVSQSASPHAVGHGVRIFTYPKILFIFPSMIAALICGLGMILIRDNTVDPLKGQTGKVVQVKAAPAGEAAQTQRILRFSSAQNIFSMFFLFVFAFNMVVLAIDFPRFTLLAVGLLGAALVFFFLWLNVYFDLIPPIVNALESIYAVANAQFYFLFATIIIITLGVIYVSRWLDYWEVLPNEILHHHGPLSDLERYPTFNLKFDKEIPDVLEFLMLGAGRLVLHPQGEQKSIFLDNVLFINSKEVDLKRLMSRMEVRVTTDKEVAQET